MFFVYFTEFAIICLVIYFVVSRVIVPAIQKRQIFLKTEREKRLEQQIREMNQKKHEDYLHKQVRKGNE